MDMLLDVIDDLVHVPCRIADVQSAAGSGFYDGFVMPLADGRFRVRTKQRNDASLVLGGYSARCLALLAIYGT